MDSLQTYHKGNPFLACIKTRHSLCKEGSKKSTYHIVLDLEGSGITYQVGDSLAVFPDNDAHIVETTLALLQAAGNEPVLDKNTQKNISFKEYLVKKANLAEVPRKLIVEVAKRQTNEQKKARLELLVSEGQRELLKEYQATHEVWDALAENHEVRLTPEELAALLQPLLPRFYSIASSMKKVGNEVHLMVAELNYHTNGHKRSGVCTHYLCHRAPVGSAAIPIYLQSANGFTIPEDDSQPLIMIGPGTGVAPFRAFMQERHARKADGLHWLFFGECHRATEFFYEQEWEEFCTADYLRLDAAFSRDQEHKVYVQHKMIEKGEELYSLLENGAYLYVCGDAHRMAKDVDAALHTLVQKHGNLDEAGAKHYVKQLRASKRYLRDIY